MDSSSESGLWVICPMCHQPNPRERTLCKECWAMLSDVQQSFSYKEAQELSNQYMTRKARRRKIRRLATTIGPAIILIVVVFLSLFSLTDVVGKPSETINSNSMPGEWAMFQHDITHSGTTGGTATLPQGNIKWKFETGASIHSSPAVAYDTVYFGSADGKLYAVDAATGTERWEFKTGSWVESSPAVVNGVVYFGSNDGNFYALDAHNG